MDYETDFEEGYTHTSLGKIYYKRHRAQGKKLIFLHGLGGTTKVWDRLMKFMPDDLDISLIDLLGHGNSDSPEELNYRVSEQVQILNEFIADQNNGSSCIVGHSYGGWVAAYYTSYPYASSSLVLEASAGLKEDEDEFAQKLDGEEYREKFLKDLLALNNKEFVMRRILNAAREEELDSEVLGRIKKSTLIVWGSQDKRVDVKYAAIFKERIKGSRLEIIENEGHYPHYTKPEEFSNLILGFLGK